MKARIVTAIVWLAVGGHAAAAPPTGAAPELLAQSDASFDRPHDLVMSPDGRFLYVADSGNDRVVTRDQYGFRTQISGGRAWRPVLPGRRV